FEGEKLEYAERDGAMEAQPSLVRAECAVHLDAKAAVDLDLSAVVLPVDAEHDHALRLHQPLEDLRLPEVRPAIHDKVEALEHLFDGLVELGFGRVPGMHLGEDFRDVRGDGRAGGSADQHCSSFAELGPGIRRTTGEGVYTS